MVWIQNYFSEGERLFPGKKNVLALSLSAIILRSHLLIEDLPGMGKTTLTHYLAKAFGLDFKRIQGTSDLLPADITGINIFHPGEQKFQFKPGPIFAELLLMDELNRAPAKTQGALLQAMEEKTVVVDGNNYQLPEHFCVMATQNPSSQRGTYTLPESQLDRFLYRFPMGYPDKKAEIDILKHETRRSLIQKMSSLSSIKELDLAFLEVQKIHVSDKVADYIWRLLDDSRKDVALLPLSPRCGIDIVKSSKCLAYLNQRDHVLPDDVQEIFPYVSNHRLAPDSFDKGFEAAHLILSRVSIL